MDHGKRDTHSSDRRFASLVATIIEARNQAPATRALLVGISGIDGSGQGFVSVKLADALRATSLNVALISADDWLNLPDVFMNPTITQNIFTSMRLVSMKCLSGSSISSANPSSRSRRRAMAKHWVPASGELAGEYPAKPRRRAGDYRPDLS